MKLALRLMNDVGRRLLSERQAAAALEAAQGEKIDDSQARDLLSLLVRANAAASARERMPDEQMLARRSFLSGSPFSDLCSLAEIPTFILAGHDTTSTVISWTLFELASDPSVQARLRAECRTLSLPEGATDNAPIDAEVLSALDKLPLLDAVVRETLRLHAPVYSSARAPVEDDDIPVATPFVDVHGVSRSSIPFVSRPSLKTTTDI
jgi:cytochrome P450